MSLCPCGSKQDFDGCCGPLLAGTPAPTAEALMRSRFTAHVKVDIDYLRRSLAPELRDDFDAEETRRNATEVEWEELTIRDTLAGGPEDSTGEVEFIAKYRTGGRSHLHHERSTFRRDGGAWVFVDGIVNPKAPPKRVEKVGRNDPCTCGSGKKYKKCCGLAA